MKPLALCVAAAFAFPSHAGGTLPANALPEGGKVIAGQASIAQAGNRMDIAQGSQRAILDWTRFNIGSQASVNFAQPDASAVALNRVVASDASHIEGQLSANGQVWLINPAGVIFGQGSRVDVGGLVASTLDTGNADFMAGKADFTGSGQGTILNRGTLHAAEGGTIALLGGQVINEGVISATLGNVVLASGSRVTLDQGADGKLRIAVDPGTYDALVANRQLIQADGGQILLTTAAAGQLRSAVVSNSGTLEARTLQNRQGRILLLSDLAHGQTDVGGILDASAEHGDGGSIETSGAKVGIDPEAKISTHAKNGKTGTWLVDPQDFTIAASGGDITGLALGTQLDSTNVTLQSSSGGTAGSGDLKVNDAVSWSANTTLTLQAARNININQSITATGNTAGLTLTSTGSYSLNNGAKVTLLGTAPSLTIQGTSYTVINDVNALQAMNSNLAGNYALGSDINASATAGWNSGAGFVPVGNATTKFTGTFDGFGHTIGSLTINRTGAYVGLFGYSSGVLRDVGLVADVIAGTGYVGGLIGANTGSVSNNYAKGISVFGSGGGYIGGLVGANLSGGRITNSYATGTVSGGAMAKEIGGLVGYNTGTIATSYATGSVSGGASGGGDLGGLVGRNGGAIADSYATGTVSGKYAGGLVGFSTGSITNSYATGSVFGNALGGLVGANFGPINTSYATGAVSGTGSIGGLVGDNDDIYGVGRITNSYSTGSVSGSGSIGGLVGANWGIMSNSYTTGSVTAVASSSYVNYVGGLVGNAGMKTISGCYWNLTANPTLAEYSNGPMTGGLMATQLQTQSSFVGWDFTNTWRIYEGQSYPVLRALQTNLTVSANDATKVYDGQTYSDGSGVSYLSGWIASADPGQLGTVSYAGSAQGAVNAGSYAITPTYTRTAQQAYQNWGDISYADGALTVAPKSLTVTGTTAQDKVYDGTTTATLAGGTLSGLIAGDAVDLSLANGRFDTKSVGTNKTVSYDASLTGTGIGNYVLASTSGTTTADITPKWLTLTGTTAQDKVYDGTTTATLMGGTLNGIIAGDAVTFAQSGNFDNKNVGTGKTVTYNASLAGAGARNYALASASGTTTADITPRSLTIATAMAQNKVYDGTTTATFAGGTLNGVIAGDVVDLSLSNGSFDNKNVGTGKTVSYDASLAGTGIGNYVLAGTSGTTTADITPKSLTVTGTTAKDKFYDGTTTATLTGGALNGVIAGDAVTLAQSGNFDNKNIGTSKTVVFSNGILGNDAGNYALSSLTGTTTANILGPLGAGDLVRIERQGHDLDAPDESHGFAQQGDGDHDQGRDGKPIVRNDEGHDSWSDHFGGWLRITDNYIRLPGDDRE